MRLMSTSIASTRLRACHSRKRKISAPIVGIIYAILAISTMPYVSTALSGWSFLPNQLECRLKCENGGVCAFNTNDPERHKCICFIGMFRGEQCEIAVQSDAGEDVARPTDNAVNSEDGEEADEDRKTNDDDVQQSPLDVEDHAEGGIGGDFGADDDDDDDDDNMEPDSAVTTLPSVQLAGQAANVDNVGEELSYEAELITADNRGGATAGADAGARASAIPPPSTTTPMTTVEPSTPRLSRRDEISPNPATVPTEQQRHAAIPTPPRNEKIFTTALSSTETFPIGAVPMHPHFALAPAAADSPLSRGSTSAFADDDTRTHAVTAASAGRRRITRPRRPTTTTTEWPEEEMDEDTWDGGWMMDAKRSSRSAALRWTPSLTNALALYAMCLTVHFAAARL